MGFRLGVIFFLLVSLTCMVDVDSTPFASWDTDTLTLLGANNVAPSLASANLKVGDLIGQDEEMMLDSEASRRVLARRSNYISYGALQKNNVPCNRRGNSYYNCQGNTKANPYRRGCNQISRCARRT